MKQLRVAVYTIAKNEQDNVEPWAACMQEADGMYVVDTGSSDVTVNRLCSSKAYNGTAYVLPWRFDDAFNAALCALPPDIDVVCRFDLDDRPQPGWRAALERAWTPGTTMLRYPYQYSAKHRFYSDRIHARAGYRWRGATHEHLIWRGDGQAREAFCDDLVVRHDRQDHARPNDLPLLEESAMEHPTDSEVLLYLGRELLFKGELARAAEVLTNAVALLTDQYRRAVALRWLDQAQGRTDNKLLLKARDLCNNRSITLALLRRAYQHERWQEVLGLHAKLNLLPYDEGWADDMEANDGAIVPDLTSIAAFNVGHLHLAKRLCQMAIARSKPDERLQKNLELIEAASAVDQHEATVRYQSLWGVSPDAVSASCSGLASGAGPISAVPCANAVTWGAPGPEV